jgi:hypothetical protein
MSFGRTEATTADQPIRDEARRTHAEVLRSFTPPGRRPKARNSSADRDPTDMIDSEEDPTLRAVLVGILREPNRLRNSNRTL